MILTQDDPRPPPGAAGLYHEVTMTDRPTLTDDNIVLRKSEHLDDWYTIEREVPAAGGPRLEHGHGRMMRLWLPERLSDACIEGTADEMRDIARAILARREVHHKRCAVVALNDGDECAEMWSPRNSTIRARVPLTVADDFARRALAMLDGASHD